MIEALSATKRNTRGLISLVVVVLAWGSLWPVNKALLAYTPPIWSIAAHLHLGGDPVCDLSHRDGNRHT